MEVRDEGLIIGPGYEIDPTVILGYKTGRSIEDLTLRVGRGAKLRTGTILYCGVTIGDNFQTGHNVIVREENVIGDNVSIWSGSYIDYRCRIGNNVRIHCDCHVTQFVTIEDDVFIGPGFVTSNDVYPLMEEAKPFLEGCTIKRGALIGVNVTILPRVIIGEGALVGAGSVVTKNVEPDAVVVGNPARVINRVENLRPIQQRVALERGEAGEE
jgi:acetyltransferase-like isoleucine patch superfamily enzyme